MIINKQTFFLIAVCFLYTISNFSQIVNKEKKLLVEILTEVENQHKVTFTYADKTVENIEIQPYTSDLSLKEIIQYLKKETKLNFTFISASDILINDRQLVSKLCGILIDADTHKKIEGAYIIVDDMGINTVSNGIGQFELESIAENQIIDIQHISYPSIHVYASQFKTNNSCLPIYLSQNVEKLKEVFLNNYLTSGITNNIDNTTTINTLKSGILPGLIEPDILHKIQALPGVGSINETISNINIRGGSNDENLLLWDGIKMYHSGHFFGLISAFNPYITEEVTVIKNGTSPQFGDGVSGTISIKLFDKVKEKSFGGGGLNSLSTDLYAYLPMSKKTGVLISGRRSLIDIINTPAYRQYFKRAFQDTKIKTTINQENDVAQTKSNFNFYDYSIKYLYDISDKHTISLSFLTIKNNLDYTETIKTNLIDNSKTSSLNQQNMALGFNMYNSWNVLFETRLQTYYTKYTINAINYTLLTDQRLIQNNEVQEAGVKLNTHYKIGRGLKFLNGYHFYELGVQNSEFLNLPLYSKNIKKVIRNHSLYSELNYLSPEKNTSISAGVRINYIDKFKVFNIEPRIQALYKLNTQFAFKVGGELKSQHTAQTIDLQEDFLGVEKRRWILTDNDLIPILKSQQVSIGLNYKKNNFFIDIEGFYKNVDGITVATQAFQNQYQFKKTIGSYNIKGIEFLINKKKDFYSLWLGYSFNKNNYFFPELTPTSFPNNIDIRHSISTGSSIEIKNFNVALGLLWRTGKPYTAPNVLEPIINGSFNTSINYKEPNSSRLPNYFRADLSSTYSFNFNKNINGLVGISVLNLLNKTNVLNTYYKVNTNQSISRINSNSIGITPNFTIRASF